MKYWSKFSWLTASLSTPTISFITFFVSIVALSFIILPFISVAVPLFTETILFSVLIFLGGLVI